MMRSLFESLFGCTHGSKTFPITPAKGKDTYVSCLDCGKKWAYDWSTMSTGKPIAPPRPRRWFDGHEVHVQPLDK